MPYDFPHFPKLRIFIGQKLGFHLCCIQNVKDGIQIQVCNIINESVSHSKPLYFSKS